jgi:hypothetical protein
MTICSESIHSKQKKDEKRLSSNWDKGFERFVGFRKSKLMLRRDGSFKFLERLNAYKVDL